MRPLRLCAAILLFPSCSLCCGFLSNVLTHAHKEYDILTTPFRNPLWNRCGKTKRAAFDPWDRGHLPRLLSAYFGYFAVNLSPFGLQLARLCERQQKPAASAGEIPTGKSV